MQRNHQPETGRLRQGPDTKCRAANLRQLFLASLQHIYSGTAGLGISAYRIQELAYGGLSEETIERLDALADELEGKKPKRGHSLQDRPMAGTRLIREWRGIQHSVTVRQEDFEYKGRPYKSLSAIARLITGTQWNGLVFFGLKNTRGPS
jgi:hypothetical protein